MDVSAAPAAALIQREGGVTKASLSSIKHDAQLQAEVVNMAFETGGGGSALPADPSRGRTVNTSA